MAAQITCNTHLINHNFLIVPGPAHRSLNNQILPKKEFKSNTQDQSKLFNKSLMAPFPHFPLEVPRISRLIYKPINFAQHKRWVSMQRTSRSSLDSQETALPSLKNRQKTRKLSIEETIIPDLFHVNEKNWEFTERVYWNKRKISALPLAIIVYEGVIGDFYRQNLWDIKSTDMAVCPGWIAGLHSLHKACFIAVVTRSEEKAGFISEFLLHNSIKVDAIYKRKGIMPPYFQDYSQIMEEFGKKKAILLSSIALESDEINIRSEWGLFFENSLSCQKKIVTTMCPCHTSENYSIVTLLIPNPRAQPKENAINFNEISEIVTKLMNKKIINHIFETEVIKDLQNIRLFSIPYSKFDSNYDSIMKIIVFVGVEKDKRPYLHYHYRFIKTEIELNKLQT